MVLSWLVLRDSCLIQLTKQMQGGKCQIETKMEFKECIYLLSLGI